jgi:hypothetical protein
MAVDKNVHPSVWLWRECYVCIHVRCTLRVAWEFGSRSARRKVKEIDDYVMWHFVSVQFMSCLHAEAVKDGTGCELCLALEHVLLVWSMRETKTKKKREL